MTMIIDPTNLTYIVDGVPVAEMLRINTTAKTMTLVKAGALTDDGVTGQCVYSKLKEIWKDDSTAIKFAFPMEAITEEKFDLINGWDWGTSGTRLLIRNAGWALKDALGVSQEEYSGIISLGSLVAGTTAYDQQVLGGVSTDFALSGTVNQAVKVFGDVTHDNFDYRSYFKMFARAQANTFALAQLEDIGVTTMTYQVYRFPLATTTDSKVTHADITVAAYGVTITWYAAPQARTIGGTSYNFHVIIDGNNKTAEEIYEYIQYALRLDSDIDAGSGSHIGKVTDPLLRFVGDTLYAIKATEGGVYIDNFLDADINRMVMIDDLGAPLTFPYVALLELNFGDNLVNDAAAEFTVFFTSGFGTTGAIIVNDADAAPITGSVGGHTSLSFTFDYDGNVQGGRTPGEDAAITCVAIGLTTGQYVKATGTITKSTTNAVTLTSSLERNYSNP